MKKFIASFVSAALVLTGPGYAAAGGNKQAVVTGPAGAQARTAGAANIPSLGKGIDAVAGKAIGGAHAIQGGARAEAGVPGIAVQAVAPGMTQVLHAIGQSEQAGGVEVAQALEHNYTNGRVELASHQTILGRESAGVQVLARASTMPGRSANKRDGADMSAIQLGLLGAGSLLGIGLIIPRTRSIIMHYAERALDAVTPAEYLFNKIMKQLETAEKDYNGRVKSAKELVADRQRTLDEQAGELKGLERTLQQKVAQAKGAAEGTPAYDAAREEGVGAMNAVNRMKAQMELTKQAVADATESYKLTMQERENFFNIKAERAGRALLRITQDKTGKHKATLAGMKQKYQIEGEKTVEKLGDKADQSKAKGDAAMDAVNSSSAAQKIDGENRAKQKQAENDFDKMLKGEGKSMVEDGVGFIRTGIDNGMDLVKRAPGSFIVGAIAAATIPGLAVLAAVVGAIAMAADSLVTQKLSDSAKKDVLKSAAIGLAAVGLGMAIFTSATILGALVAPAFLLGGVAAINIVGSSSKSGGMSMLDQGAGAYMRVASWMIGGVGLFLAASAGATYMIGAFALISILGALSIYMKPSPAARRLGADVFIIGASTAAVGLAAAKVSAMFGIAVTMVGSMTFLAPAMLAAGLGFLGATKAFMGMRKAGTMPAPAPVVVPEVKMEPAQSFNPFMQVAAHFGDAAAKTAQAGMTAAAATAKQAGARAANAADQAVSGLDRIAERATQGADELASQPVPEAPAAGEIAGRAAKAGEKLAEAGKTAAGAAARHAGAAMRDGADKAVSGMESLADKASKAAGDLASSPEKAAPSADEIVGRLRDVSSRLASVGVKVAENQVEKLEKMADPNAPKDQSAGLITRFFRALAGILDLQLTKIESSPEYQAYLARKSVADGEKQFQSIVYQAAYQYHLKERQIDNSQAESKRLAGLIKSLLSPRADGTAPTAQDEQAAANLVNAKRIEDMKTIANLKALDVAKAGFEQAVKSRALVMANAVDKMIAINAGLTEATIGDLTARLKLMESDYISGMNEISARFSAEVAKRLAASDAARTAAELNPSVRLAQAEQQAAAMNVQDEITRLKSEYSR